MVKCVNDVIKSTVKNVVANSSVLSAKKQKPITLIKVTVLIVRIRRTGKDASTIRCRASTWIRNSRFRQRFSSIGNSNKKRTVD